MLQEANLFTKFSKRVLKASSSWKRTSNQAERHLEIEEAQSGARILCGDLTHKKCFSENLKSKICEVKALYCCFTNVGKK